MGWAGRSAALVAAWQSPPIAASRACPRNANMEPSALRSTVLAVCLSLGVPVAVYLGLLGAMIVAPSFQAHAIYLHKIMLTWFKDLNVPEQFGLAHRQATPFYIPTSDGEKLHAWHVLPIGAYITN